MIKEKFSISNSRLSVVSITAEPSPRGDGYVKIPINDIKKSMRYQVLSVCDTTSGNPITMLTWGVQEVTLPGKDLKDITGVYALVKEPTKSGEVVHSVAETKVIMAMLYSLPDFALDVKEQLILSTKDQGLIDSFYNGYGDKGALKAELVGRLADKSYTVGKVQPQIQARTFRPGKRYSVYRLIHDLVADKAKILLSSDLIGKYSRITASKKVVPTDTTYQSDDWCQVIGYQGNKTRANLSLQYQGKVTVDVPVNQLGVTAGPRELKCIRTVSLIKDGRNHIEKLGVIVSENLARRLRGTGCVEDGNLVYKGALLLNLTKLPAISKGEIKKVASWYMAELEVKKFIADLAMDYIGVMRGTKAMPGTKPAPDSPSDAFLKSLGIYGDEYIPHREIPAKEGRSYCTREVITKISGIEMDPMKQWKFISDYTRGTVYNPSVKGKAQLNKIISMVNPKGLKLDDLEKEWSAKQKALADEIRDRKFQLIMSKTMDFADVRSGRNALNLIKSVDIYGDPTAKVSVSWRIKESTINI